MSNCHFVAYHVPIVVRILRFTIRLQTHTSTDMNHVVNLKLTLIKIYDEARTFNSRNRYTDS